MKYNKIINDATFADLRFKFLRQFGAGADIHDWIKVTNNGEEEAVLEGEERDEISKKLFEDDYKKLKFDIIHVHVYEGKWNGWAFTDYGFHFRNNEGERLCIPYIEMNELDKGEIKVNEKGVVFKGKDERTPYGKMFENDEILNIIKNFLMDIKDIKFKQ